MAALVDHHDSIAVAVECEPHVRADACHREFQQIGPRGAATVVDVSPVRRAAYGHDVGAEIGDHARRNLVRRPMRRIDDDFEVFEPHAGRDRGPAKLHVVRARARHGLRLSQRARVTRDRHRVEPCFDGFLEGVGELLSVSIEELDSVIVVRIVRSADDDAEICAQLFREHGDRGCG